MNEALLILHSDWSEGGVDLFSITSAYVFLYTPGSAVVGKQSPPGVETLIRLPHPTLLLIVFPEQHDTAWFIH